MLRKYLNFRTIRQIIFIIKIFFLQHHRDNISKLSKNGFISINDIFKKKYSKSLLIKYNKKLKNNWNFVSKYKILDSSDLNEILNLLKEKEIIKLVKAYLGQNIICYDNVVLYLGNKISKKDSWQPHHDSKENRIKIYFWLSENNKDNQPIFYQIGSHKQLKFWNKYRETRFEKYSKINKLGKIIGKQGGVSIFDTHGLHSGYKLSKIPRVSIVLTFESVGMLKRINSQTKFGKKEISRLNAFKV